MRKEVGLVPLVPFLYLPCENCPKGQLEHTPEEVGQFTGLEGGEPTKPTKPTSSSEPRSRG